jgi:hypothetical protein
VNNAGEGAKWWRAKQSPYLVTTTVEWFDRTRAYSGRLVERDSTSSLLVIDQVAS